MKPVQLIPPAFALAWLGLAPVAWAQVTPAADSEPAAATPAPPPAPQAAAAPVAAPPPADLPPPPPPRGNPPPPPQGKLVISTPPPLIDDDGNVLAGGRPRAGYKVHDGFYLRMGLGLGGGNVNVSTDSNVAKDFSFGGAGLALNLWIGGTPWRGVAIGGLFSVQGMAETNAEVDGTKTKQEAAGSTVLLGPFIDAFPDPLRGLHVGGSLALAGAAAKAKGNVLRDTYQVKDYSGGGLAASGWVGYMGWVGPEWSMGGLLQLTALRVQDDRDDVKRLGTGYTLSLSFTALYH